MDSDLPRVVLDTNIFVSALISSTGFPFRILQASRQERLVHLVSDPIVDEYLRVLDYPHIRKIKGITDILLAEVVSYLVHRTERVELVSSLDLSPDPEDNVFLDTAIDGDAAMLVTGDKTDLLALRFVEGIPIISAKDAVGRLGI
ncbi:MAG TPA: putative toxin-antitoxin system toxin component, PIN family [Terriglobales bacterium]|nr:putative toxin-antitoxin system toxin component, PIN family [Terriglobales bacterium]